MEIKVLLYADNNSYEVLKQLSFYEIHRLIKCLIDTDFILFIGQCDILVKNNKVSVTSTMDITIAAMDYRSKNQNIWK